MTTTVPQGAATTPPPTTATRRTSELAKRGFDLVAAIAILVVLAPLLLVVVGLTLVTSGPPVIFRQTRIGRHGKPFRIYKFRTMYKNNDDSAHREQNRRQLAGGEGHADGLFKDRHDARVTPIGRLLRRLSLDEVPQLVNVIKGEMSLVGPRPSIPWEVDLYEDRFQARHDVRPGLTGLWQVSGRNRLSMLDMLALDVRYVEGRSLWGDVWILLRTPLAVVRGDGA